MLLTQLRRSVVLAVVAFVFFGFVYALVGTGVSQLLFKNQASGSLGANGSTLIGQSWSGTRWFHGRPDSDNPLAANGAAGSSGASNLGPRSKTLVVDTRKVIEAWHKVGVDPTSDLVTTSASGLDPDITPADATAQIPMIARSRGISPAALQGLINRETHSAQLGFLGSPYIVVLQLNEALAALR